MPLGFYSVSHGQVAFGFFHIETHMVLLNDLFFWARDICAFFRALAQKTGDRHGELQAWRLGGPDAGNLHGAIAGVDHGGFIGELYRQRPFPKRREDFKQHTGEGFPPRAVEDLINRHGQPFAAALKAETRSGLVTIGEYAFDKSGLCGLAGYLLMGGMPRWQNELAPGYVADMGRAMGQGSPPWFAGCQGP